MIIDEDVRGILDAWLEQHGYDGLYSPGECACRSETIGPCDCAGILKCKPGYLQICTECDLPHDGCGHDWCIGERRPVTAGGPPLKDGERSKKGGQ